MKKRFNLVSLLITVAFLVAALVGVYLNYESIKLTGFLIPWIVLILVETIPFIYINALFYKNRDLYEKRVGSILNSTLLILVLGQIAMANFAYNKTLLTLNLLYLVFLIVFFVKKYIIKK